jgi:hypothetical protein
MPRTWPQRSLISGRLTQLTMLFCKRLTNNLLRHFAKRILIPMSTVR